MASYDDLNTRQIWIVGTISAVLTAVTILAVQVLYFALLSWHDEAKLASFEYTTSVQHIVAQQAGISNYGRNPESKAIEIPIERAMELVIQRSKGTSDEATPTDEKATDAEDRT